MSASKNTGGQIRFQQKGPAKTGNQPGNQPGKGGRPSTTGNPSGKGRENSPPKK